MAAPFPKWRLVIQGEGERCIPYLLEFVRARYFLDGSHVPVWRAPSRPALCAYPAIELTARANPGHYFRLTTGVEPQEQRMSESLNFRGMWPQEIYVYMREFQHAMHSYVRDTFVAQIEHEERLRERRRMETEANFQLRQQRTKQRIERNKKIIALKKAGKTAFGIAVELGVKYSTVCSVIKASGLARQR